MVIQQLRDQCAILCAAVEEDLTEDQKTEEDIEEESSFGDIRIVIKVFFIFLLFDFYT